MSSTELLLTAVAHHRAGRLVEAEQLYRQLLANDPRHADAWQLLGAIDYQSGRFAEAVEHIQQAIALGVRHAGLLNNLGAALRALGRNAEAFEVLRQSLELDPRNASAWNNYANALKQRDELDEAAKAYLQALALDPRQADAHDNLARLYQQRHDFFRAIHHYRQSLAHKPHNPRAYNNLGAVLLAVGERAEAMAAFDKALEQQPNYARAWNNRGSVLRECGRLVEAEQAFRHAWELDSSLVEAANNYGEVCGAQGRIDEGLAILQRAIEQAPNAAPIHSNYVMLQQYRSGIRLAELQHVHRGWAARHAEVAAPARSAPPGSRDPQRPLRVGFISADLGRHPVGCIVLPLLEQLDRQAFEPWLYSNRDMQDQIQQQLRQRSHWRDVASLTDEQLHAQIDADQIDVLFDLSGHTAHNRLKVFARRAAPVQATWAGYQSTTGIAAMDFLLSDRVMAPSEHQPYFCERLVHLPEASWCCRIESPPLDPGPPPSTIRGAITFGSFNNASKISPVVVELWSRVLNAVPGSRLVLKYRGFDDPSLAARYRKLFSSHGIDSFRIDCRGPTSFEQMLTEYREVDIALDPFPFGGGMTSLISLWMGVPVVTLPGETLASRQTLSMLTALDERSLSAADSAAYIDIAVELARDSARLDELRRTLRPRLERTQFLDAERFTRNWQQAVRFMWQGVDQLR